MQTMELTELGNALQRMWEPNRESIRRLLISLTRDIDLADDLLQETYLHARSGIEGFRGGDARAWLAAIAKNAFYAHARRSSTKLETSLLPDDELGSEASTGSSSYLALLELRQAVADLSPTLRTALIMKHYGGFTYLEIAERLGCPVGTAKWRVREAIGKLRMALGAKEEAGVKCAELMGTSIIDYLYGIPSDATREKIKRHIEKCDVCRSAVDDLRKVTTGLDALTGEYKMMHIVELDDKGLATIYMSASLPNSSKEPARFTTFDCEKYYPVDYVSVFGEEVPFEVAQSENCDHRYTYTIRLPRVYQPREQINSLVVGYGSRHEPGKQGTIAGKMADGSWHYLHQQAPGDEGDFVFVLAIRLPSGAVLARTYARRVPSGDEVSCSQSVSQQSDGIDRTTVTCRSVLAPNEQLDCELFYTLPEIV